MVKHYIGMVTLVNLGPYYFTNDASVKGIMLTGDEFFKNTSTTYCNLINCTVYKYDMWCKMTQLSISIPTAFSKSGSTTLLESKSIYNPPQYGSSVNTGYFDFDGNRTSGSGLSTDRLQITAPLNGASFKITANLNSDTHTCPACTVDFDLSKIVYWEIGD